MKGLASFANEWTGGRFPVPAAAVGWGVPPPTRDDGAADDAARENARLRSRKHALGLDAAMWESKSAEAKDAVYALVSQIDRLRNDEIQLREGTLRILRSQLEEELRLAGEYRDEFLKTHERTSGEIAGGRTGGVNNDGIAFGPGHTVKNRREIRKMDSLEDYEKYIEDREDALWMKIDILVDKIKKDSRREAIEW
jgi:hypothetical protein